MLPLLVLTTCLISFLIQSTQAEQILSTSSQQSKKKSDNIEDQSVPFATIARNHRSRRHHHHHERSLLPPLFGSILFPDTSRSYRRNDLSIPRLGIFHSHRKSYRSPKGHVYNKHRTLHTPFVHFSHTRSNRRYKH